MSRWRINNSGEVQITLKHITLPPRSVRSSHIVHTHTCYEGQQFSSSLLLFHKACTDYTLYRTFLLCAMRTRALAYLAANTCALFWRMRSFLLRAWLPAGSIFFPSSWSRLFRSWQPWNECAALGFTHISVISKARKYLLCKRTVVWSCNFCITAVL